MTERKPWEQWLDRWAERPTAPVEYLVGVFGVVLLVGWLCMVFR